MANEQTTLPTFNELAKFSMYTPSPGAEGKRAKLAWVVRDGNPRISVSTFNPSDTVKAPINAAMNPETFEIFLNEFERIIRSEKPEKMKIDCLRGVRGGEDNRVTEKVLDSELWFGKDDEGVAFISVISGTRPKIKFEFNISDYHKIHRSSGPITKAEASCLQALATVQTIRRVFTQYYREFRQKFASASYPAKTTTVATTEGSTNFADIDF
jgi:hypothetical protein